jgi:ribosomal-protein-alanine N-acetyltransferase
MDQPTLYSERLILRALRVEDAADVARLAGARAIADTTVTIPHPYSTESAVHWIAELSRQWAEGSNVVFALSLRGEDALVGAIGLSNVDPEHYQAEMGYWIGVPWWGRGYASEAAALMLAFGFETLGLNRIYAHHMLRNPVSGHILRKVGMRAEGVLRQRVRKWGKFEDVALLSILKSEWLALRAADQPRS